MEKYKCELEDGLSLCLYSNDEAVFKAKGKWLYPLFEVEEFLLVNHLDNLSLHDTISGIAAAFLVSRLNIKRVHADIMSKGALEVYKRFNIQATYGTLVDRILCKTESLFNINSDVEEVYKELYRRANIKN